MVYTRKQLITCISIVYLILVTAVGGYASCRANRLSVPIPQGLRIVATALPIVSGLLLEVGYDLTCAQERRRQVPRNSTPRPPFVMVANAVIFIYSTVVITLLGTHAAPPSGLDCGLRDGWQALFRQRNVEAIRTIQDAYNCCGFKSVHDMAWPFPDKKHRANACETAFERSVACVGPWRAEEQQLAGILMAVVGLVFVWQFLIIAVPTQRQSWVHKVVPGRISDLIADEEHGSDRPQRAIDYSSNSHRYSDRIEEEAENGNGQSEPQRAIQGRVHGVDEEQVLGNAWAGP